MHLLYAVYAHLSSPSSQFPHPCGTLPFPPFISSYLLHLLHYRHFSCPGSPLCRPSTHSGSAGTEILHLHRRSLLKSSFPPSYPTVHNLLILVVFHTSPFHLDGDIRIASRIPRKILENLRFPPRSSESTSFIDSWHWIADRRSPHARVGEDDEKRGKSSS